jgi:hypothetical protein
MNVILWEIIVIFWEICADFWDFVQAARGRQGRKQNWFRSQAGLAGGRPCKRTFPNSTANSAVQSGVDVGLGKGMENKRHLMGKVI